MVSLIKIVPAEHIAQEVDSLFDIGYDFLPLTGFKNTDSALGDNKLAMLSHYYKMCKHMKARF